LSSGQRRLGACALDLDDGLGGSIGLVRSVVLGFLLEQGRRDGLSALAGVLESEQAETDPGQARPQQPAQARLVEPLSVEREDDEHDGPEDGENSDGTNAVNVHRLDVRRLSMTTPSIPHITTG
jgi:hypothetical protein